MTDHQYLANTFEALQAALVTSGDQDTHLDDADRHAVAIRDGAIRNAACRMVEQVRTMLAPRVTLPARTNKETAAPSQASAASQDGRPDRAQRGAGR